MENDKFQVIVDHLVRLTQEITEIKSNQQQFSAELSKTNQTVVRIENEELTKLNQTVTRIENEGLAKLNQTVARIEHDHGEKLRALFDARTAQLEVNDRIINTLSRIEEKLDYLSIQVAPHDLLLRKS